MLFSETELFLDGRTVDFLQALTTTLSSLESDALRLYLDGKSYDTMAVELECDTKTIDNALQRVKRKVLMHQKSREVLA